MARLTAQTTPVSSSFFPILLRASIFFNTTSLISKARHKLILGILWRADIKTHLEVSVEGSLQAYFRQLSPGWSQPGGAAGHRSVLDFRDTPAWDGADSEGI